MKLDQVEIELKQPLWKHRPGCCCIQCLPKHHQHCQCSACQPREQFVRVEASMPVRCPVCQLYRFTKTQKCPNNCVELASAVLPDERPYCFIIHNGECDCEPPVVVNKGMLDACQSASLYMLSVLRTDAKPRTGLTRDDLDFLAVSTSKMAAHWGRRALGQQDLL